MSCQNSKLKGARGDKSVRRKALARTFNAHHPYSSNLFLVFELKEWGTQYLNIDDAHSIGPGLRPKLVI